MNRSRLAEPVAVVGLTGIVAGAYVWTKASLYNPAASIDPWLYTALWTNFDQVYHWFIGTYYASRLPWIVPGYVLARLFGLHTAFFVVHVSYFFAGGLFLYLTCRRYFGWIPAAAAYTGLIANQMYFNAHRWDYEEGAVLTYLAAVVYFAMPSTHSARRRLASLACAGFFSAALVTTQLVDIVFLVGLPLLWWAAFDRSGDRRSVQLAEDVGAFLAGFLALLALGGVFALANGGHFLFFMPQIHSALSTNGAVYHQSAHVWLQEEPYFFTPLFTVVLALMSLFFVRPRLSARSRRVLLAIVAWTAVVFVVLVIWEFTRSGFFFEYVWYFSAFLVPMNITLAGLGASAIADLRDATRSRGAILFLVASAVAALAPLLWVYRDDLVSRVASGARDMGLESRPYELMTFGMLAAILLLILSRLRRTAVLAIASVALAFLAVGYGTDASKGTSVDGFSDPDTGSLYNLGSQEIAFLHENGFKKTRPYFWYNAGENPRVLTPLLSLYFFSYSYVGSNMPSIDSDFKSRMSDYNPDKLVLLCMKTTCRGGPAALKKAGYQIQLLRQHRLSSGTLGVWLEIYQLKSKPTSA